MPVLISLVLSILLGGTGVYAYAQVQGGEREFTGPPTAPETAAMAPLAAQGDWTVHAALAYPTIVDALTTLIPAEVIRLEWRERLVPYWSLNEVDMELSAVVSRQSPAQLTVFDQELEMIQPLRLTVEARTADVSETEVRDFIVAARFGLGFDQDWNWQVIELEPARLLGFGSPRLFGSLNPDLSSLVTDLEADLAASLLENLGAELNDENALRAQLSQIFAQVALPSGNQASASLLTLAVAEGHVGDVRLSQDQVEATLIVTLAQADGEGADTPAATVSTLPKLSNAPKVAEHFQTPVAFSVSMGEAAQNLAQNERLLSVEGGELLVNKIRVLHPFGDALLVKVDAEQIDPGGHRFKKRGTFHILVEFGLHGPTQTMRVVDASMPEADNQLTFALRGRDWLRSDALALGLVSGLSGISLQGEVRAYLDRIETVLDDVPMLQGQGLGQGLGEVRFVLGHSTYDTDTVTSFVYAQMRPEIYLSQ